MSRNYSIRDFLRIAPNLLVKEYIDRNSIEYDLDFSKIKETKIEPIFELITSITNEKLRNKIDSDFQSIFQMSYEGGLKKILQTASFAGVDLATPFEKMNGFCHKVFATFIYHNKIFEDALRFACTDYLNKTYWRKIKNVIPVIEPDYENKNSDLALGISEYFRKVEGRGKSCKVDHYNQGHLHYYFCYPEDYSKSELSWEKGEFTKKVRNPAFEVIFVYDTKNKTLDSYFDGLKKTDNKLKEIFLDKVLNIDEIPKTQESTYNLDVIKEEGFEFNIPSNSIIQKVMIKSLRFLVKNRYLTTQELTSKESVQDIMEDIRSENQNINLSTDSIDKIELVATYRTKTKKGTKSKEFGINNDSLTKLNYNDEIDLALRQMIIDSGIEKHSNEEKVLKVA